MKRHIQSIKQQGGSRTVKDFDVAWPDGLEAWLADTGYSEADLLDFAWKGWIVDIGAPAVRAELDKGAVSQERAAKILAAAITDGARKQRRSKKVEALKAAGFSDAEIEVWKKMQRVKANKK